MVRSLRISILQICIIQYVHVVIGACALISRGVQGAWGGDGKSCTRTEREKAHEDGRREKAHWTEMWKEVNAWGRSCHVVDLELKVVGGAAVQ